MKRAGDIRIAPSLLEADFGRLAEQIALVEQAGADLLHLDVMDGHFVPNLTIGVPVVASLARHTSLPLDVHLMITDPERYALAFIQAGADSVTFHAEALEDPRGLIEHIHALGVQVGVALNPGTSAEAIADYVEQVDLVLVMTVWPGFGGQEFIPECLGKVAAVAARLGADQRLEVDGGITVDTAPLAVAAGADTLVAGSAIYGAADPAAEVVRLRRAATEAAAGRASSSV